MKVCVSDPVDRLLDEAESSSPLILDRVALKSTYEPDTILHRVDEKGKVTQTLLPLLKHSTPSNLLVYGKPGTGKTLVVKHVLTKIRTRVEKNKFPIQLVYTNSKTESTMYGLLVRFGLGLGMDEKKIPTTGLGIGELFNRIMHNIERNNTNVVLVVDEIDYLATLITKTKNDILYQLTRANTTLKNGSLTMVGISNDLMFKERLDPRVISSLGEEEIVFNNYSVEQLRLILEDRVSLAFAEGVVEHSAINLCAAMAGKEHGDARRAIDTLRVAGEMAERNNSGAVTEQHILLALQTMEENKEAAILGSYPLHGRVLLVAVMRSQNASTGDIYNIYKSFCKKIGQKELTPRRITQMLDEIDMSGIIHGRLVSQGVHGRTKKYTLNISKKTIISVFGNDVMLDGIVN